MCSERAEIKRGKAKKRLKVECQERKREKLKGCGRVVKSQKWVSAESVSVSWGMDMNRG